MKTAGDSSAPNFFLVGAAKSATTSLYQALRAHDDVYLPAQKEPHFYAFLADRSAAGHLFPDEPTARRRYRELYDDVTDEVAIGDASTTNLVVPGAAGAIADEVPSARIVAILRQPVDRAFAHWRHFVAAGGEDVTDFAAAVALEGARRERGFPFTYQYLGWGRYSEQLEPFLRRFGRDRVLVHLYDDLCADPTGVLRRTLRFLCVEADGALPPVGRYNEVPNGRFVPGSLRRRLRSRRRARPRRSPVLDAQLRSRLNEGFQDEITRLEELLDRDLSAWR